MALSLTTIDIIRNYTKDNDGHLKHMVNDTWMLQKKEMKIVREILIDMSIRLGNVDALKFLYQSYPIDEDFPPIFSNLDYAVSFSNRKTVKYILGLVIEDDNYGGPNIYLEDLRKHQNVRNPHFSEIHNLLDGLEQFTEKDHFNKDVIYPLWRGRLCDIDDCDDVPFMDPKCPHGEHFRRFWSWFENEEDINKNNLAQIKQILENEDIKKNLAQIRQMMANFDDLQERSQKEHSINEIYKLLNLSFKDLIALPSHEILMKTCFKSAQNNVKSSQNVPECLKFIELYQNLHPDNN